MLDTIHKSLEELLSNFYSVTPWPELGSIIVGVVRAYMKLRLDRVYVIILTLDNLLLNFDCQI